MILSRRNKPLYMQVKSILKDRILHGTYPIGELIPSEPQLEQEFQVSKITVRNAIQELVQEGYLEKGSGKGTRVIRNTSSSKLSKRKSFTEILVEEGHRIRKKILSSQAVDNTPGSEPYRLFGSQCLLVERIYYLDDVPYIYFSHYISMQAGNPDLGDLDEQSLYGLLEELEIAPVHFRDHFEIAAAPSGAAELLQVEPLVPLLRRSRYSREQSGAVVEYSVGYYNTALQPYLVDYDA